MATKVRFTVSRADLCPRAKFQPICSAVSEEIRPEEAQKANLIYTITMTEIIRTKLMNYSLSCCNIPRCCSWDVVITFVRLSCIFMSTVFLRSVFRIFVCVFLAALGVVMTVMFLSHCLHLSLKSYHFMCSTFCFLILRRLPDQQFQFQIKLLCLNYKQTNGANF